MRSAWPEGRAGSERHLHNVPLSQLPPGGDPNVVTIQLHHGCEGGEAGRGGVMAGPRAWQDSGLGLPSQAHAGQRLSDWTPTSEMRKLRPGYTSPPK